MNKKIVTWLLAIFFLTTVSLAEAQQRAKIARIGILTPDPISTRARLFETFRQGLRELGYIEGQNISIEWRSAEGRSDRVPVLAAELVSLKVDVIFTSTEPAARAAKQATTTIPSVMVIGGDPVAFGLVGSLARPGGNVTGLTIQPQELSGKRLELLKEAAPKISRVGVLSNPALPGLSLRFEKLQVEAQALGVTLHSIEVRNPNELGSAFEVVIKEQSDALFMPQPGFSNAYRKRLVDFAAKNRLPAMYPESDSVEAGGLMSYGANTSEQFRRAATYVAKILKGAKPADLPVEQPTKFELVVNRKTARQIGLTIPPGVLARADRVIK
jgi:putative tryptophan/tyrosine transport system substrate-binding protein